MYDIRFCSWNVDISRFDSGFCYYPSLLYLLCPRLEMSDGSIKRTFGEIWRECLTQFSFTALNLLTYTEIQRKKSKFLIKLSCGLQFSDIQKNAGVQHIFHSLLQFTIYLHSV